MDPFVQTFIGVAVSVTFFVLGYKKSIGARRVRIRSANEEIIRIVLKRTAVEADTMSLREISHLIEGT
ncbi:MAG: hypothetical protein ABIK83_09410, partial [Candidatus Zixiibacteriota bacterium]